MSMDNGVVKASTGAAHLICCLCGNTIAPDAKGWTGGFSAEPVDNGRCCSMCYTNIVFPARLKKIQHKD